MEELHKALKTFWSQFTWQGASVPAFPSGRVPENQPFPYITFMVAQAAFGSAVVTTNFVWCRLGMGETFNVQAQRAQIMDQVAEAIPEAGTLLALPGGKVLLQRNPADFMRYYDPPSEGEESPTAEPVIGGRISCEMRCYIC